MPTLLSDPSYAFYIIALIFSLVLIGLWYRSRDKGSAIRSGICAGVFLLIFAIDKLVESPREESVRKIQEMTTAVNEKNKEKFFENISDEFEFKGRNKEKSRSELWNAIEQYDLKVSAKTDREDVEIDKHKPVIILGFTARIAAQGSEIPVYFRATFIKDADKKWRLKSIVAYDSPIAKNDRKEMNLPGLP